MPRVLVTGSRKWTSGAIIAEALRKAWAEHPAATLMHGGAWGADTIASVMWRWWGGETETHPADWLAYGRMAGPIRNQAMVSIGPVLCLAFIRDGSPGATGCARMAERAGIETRRYYA